MPKIDRDAEVVHVCFFASALYCPALAQRQGEIVWLFSLARSQVGRETCRAQTNEFPRLVMVIQCEGVNRLWASADTDRGCRIR